MLAVLWPSHVLSIVDGAPLDGRVEAVAIGLAIPLLMWLSPRFLSRRSVRIAVAALAALKVADSTLLTQQGLCARFSTDAPYRTEVLTIPIEEPNGALRSWDVRADMRGDAPACTAIVDRPYEQASAFPAWFVNLTDFAARGRRAVALDVRGYVRVRERGLFVLDVDRGMHVSGSIDEAPLASTDGRPMLTALDPGTHRLDLRAEMSGDAWRLVPTWNGRDAFTAASLTIAEPRPVDRVAGACRAIEVVVVTLLLAGWIVSLLSVYRDSPAVVLWCLAAAAALSAAAMSPRAGRFAVLLLAGAVLVPIAPSHRNLRGAVMLVGLPFLAMVVVPALAQVGHFTAYSVDDWLAYQAAGYRIFMHGYWLEGGNRVFDYQPLYRWISGALHVVFGDSSVGELYWDAVCLLLGASLAFVLVERAAGFRWGIAAAVGTLATFWIGTIWYFPGRGLSEVAAAGWGFLASLTLLRDRASRPAIAILAGVLAVLMFYTRLNHLLFAFFLIALVTPFSVRSAGAYVATFLGGVALFAARTWWYTGHFSILYGTSLKNNDTGLRVATVFEPAVWARIWHGMRALAWMNEPPSPDPRAVLVVAGLLLSAGALLHLPRLNRLPLSLAVVTLGACVSTLFAHTHNYPGRMSIHLVPFAVAMSATAGARLLGR